MHRNEMGRATEGATASKVIRVRRPPATTPPEVGDEVNVRVRNTTLHPDAVAFD